MPICLPVSEVVCAASLRIDFNALIRLSLLGIENPDRGIFPVYTFEGRPLHLQKAVEKSCAPLVLLLDIGNDRLSVNAEQRVLHPARHGRALHDLFKGFPRKAAVHPAAGLARQRRGQNAKMPICRQHGIDIHGSRVVSVLRNQDPVVLLRLPSKPSGSIFKLDFKAVAAFSLGIMHDAEARNDIPCNVRVLIVDFHAAPPRLRYNQKAGVLVLCVANAPAIDSNWFLFVPLLHDVIRRGVDVIKLPDLHSQEIGNGGVGHNPGGYHFFEIRFRPAWIDSLKKRLASSTPSAASAALMRETMSFISSPSVHFEAAFANRESP